MFGGVSDIFLSCMIWFIYDEEGTPTIFRDERHNSTYAILDIIKPKDSFRSSVGSLDSFDTKSEEEAESRPDSMRISDRMIAQFF